MSIIGIDLDADTLKLAKISKSNKLLTYKNYELVGSNVVKQLDIDFSKEIISTGLSPSEIIIRTNSFSFKNRLFLKKALDFQSQNITSLNPKSMQYSSVYFPKKQIAKHFITTKDVLLKHINKLKHFSLSPDHITSQALALCRFAKYYDPSFKDGFIINFSKTKVSLILMKDYFVEKSHLIKIEQTKPIDYKFIENEITNLIFFLDNEKQHKTLFTGNIDQNIIDNIFTSYLDKIITNPTLDKEYNNIKKFGLAIGLALDSNTKDKTFIEFRKKEFTSKKHLKKVFNLLLIYFTSSIFLTYMFFHFTNKSLKEKESKLFKKLLEIEKSEEKTFKTKFNKKNNLYSDINILEKKLLSQNKNFPYFLNTYSVTEIIEWINNHKHLLKSEIINIEYDLENFPTSKTKSEEYLAKVTIEFKSDTTQNARDFYNSICKESELIDSSREVTWEVNYNIYKTSFYLNKKT